MSSYPWSWMPFLLWSLSYSDASGELSQFGILLGEREGDQVSDHCPLQSDCIVLLPFSYLSRGQYLFVQSLFNPVQDSTVGTGIPFGILVIALRFELLEARMVTLSATKLSNGLLEL
ncbi:hypothetical protein Tco_0788388 [Tanacetum coccineum]